MSYTEQQVGSIFKVFEDSPRLWQSPQFVSEKTGINALVISDVLHDAWRAGVFEKDEHRAYFRPIAVLPNAIDFLLSLKQERGGLTGTETDLGLIDETEEK